MSQSQIEAAIAAKLAARGAAALDPPVLQPAGLYLELVGEDLRRRAFMIEDDELCLRPDMTAPACRAALALDLWRAPFAVRYQGQVFRKEGEAGAAEFVQAGAEFFAPPGAPASEALALASALEACAAAGVKPALRLGDAAMFAALAASAGFADVWRARLVRAFAGARGPAALLDEAAGEAQPPSALARGLAKLSPAEAEAAFAEMLTIAGIAPVGGRSVGEIAARLREQGLEGDAARPAPASIAMVRAALAIEDAPDAALKALLSVAGAQPALRDAVERFRAMWADALKLAPAPAEARFSIGFGRGISYYDGLIFELEAPALGARASLGGGGRYDGLLRALAAHEGRAIGAWSAAGFAVRPKRLADAAQ
ncbi:MAG: ATP phosphoribosyltransferase regulatory subunit [Hyphomonadaceae bacterium]